jgi:hypothetical protein
LSAAAQSDPDKSTIDVKAIDGKNMKLQVVFVRFDPAIDVREYLCIEQEAKLHN